MFNTKNCYPERATSFGLTTFDEGDKSQKRSFDVHSSPSLKNNFLKHVILHNKERNKSFEDVNRSFNLSNNHDTPTSKNIDGRTISLGDKNRPPQFSGKAISLLKRKHLNSDQKKQLYNELDKCMPPISTILELYQKGRANLTGRDNRIFQELELIKGIINSYSKIDGKINANLEYYYYSQLPIKLQRRFSYIRQRDEQRKISPKLKKISKNYENFFKTGELKDELIHPDYNFEKAQNILTKTYSRISNCIRVVGTYTKRDTTDVKIATNFYCNSRFCPHCAERRKIHYRNKYQAIVNVIKNPIMITLTIKNPKEFNHKELKRLTDCIKTLWEYRKSKYTESRSFFRYISGFLRSVEVGLKKNGTYNLHAHLLCELKDEWVKEHGLNEYSLSKLQKIIKEQWHEITGDSYVVHVKELDTKEFTQAIKYIVKPQDFVKGSLKQINSAILTFYRKHITLPYGSFRDNDEIKAAVADVNNFDSQETYNDMVESDNKDAILKEKLAINFVAYEWQDNKPILRHNVKAATGEDWIFNYSRYDKELQSEVNDECYGVGYEIA